MVRPPCGGGKVGKEFVNGISQEVVHLSVLLFIKEIGAQVFVVKHGPQCVYHWC